MSGISPREEELFASALDQGSLDQALLYMRTEADNEDLRARLDKLIRQHYQSHGFLDAPPEEIDALRENPDVEGVVGSTIGPYKLLQKIGEGGMGMVYMAEQTEPVERRVAVKIIKPGMDSRQIIARLEAVSVCARRRWTKS